MLLSRDNKNIKESIVEAYNNVYLKIGSKLPKKQASMMIANNLIQLTKNASLAFLTSMETLIETLMKDDLISKNVIKSLWEIFETASTLKETVVLEKKEIESNAIGALQILSMASRFQPKIIKNNLNRLIEYGMRTPRFTFHPLFAKTICISLQNLNPSLKKNQSLPPQNEKDNKNKNKENKKENQESEDFHFASNRLSSSHPIFSYLFDLLSQPLSLPPSLPPLPPNDPSSPPNSPSLSSLSSLPPTPSHPHPKSKKGEKKDEEEPEEEEDGREEIDKGIKEWFSVYEHAINAIFLISKNPDSFFEKVIKKISSSLFSPPKKLIDLDSLSKLIFIVGHVALKELIYLEEIQSFLKLKHKKNEKQDKQLSNNKNNTNNDTNHTDNDPVDKNTTKNKNKNTKNNKNPQIDDQKENIEEELGFNKNNDETLEDEFIQNIAETQVIGSNLIGKNK